VVAPQTPPFAPAPPSTTLTARDEKGVFNLNRQAKERLRVLIRNEDMDDAWAWTCKCIQAIKSVIFNFYNFLFSVILVP
jgi:hypothetical protein